MQFDNADLPESAPVLLLSTQVRTP